MNDQRPGYEVPRTEAGRVLFLRAAGLWWQPYALAGPNAMQSAQIEVRQAILAIEAEGYAPLRLAAQNLREHIEGGMESGEHLPGDLCFRQFCAALESQP